MNHSTYCPVAQVDLQSACRREFAGGRRPRGDVDDDVQRARKVSSLCGASAVQVGCPLTTHRGVPTRSRSEPGRQGGGRRSCPRAIRGRSRRVVELTHESVMSTTVVADQIRWQKYFACALVHAHHPDVTSYARHGMLVCIDCRLGLDRARSWRWRLLEWSITAAAAALIGAPLGLASWWWPPR